MKRVVWVIACVFSLLCLPQLGYGQSDSSAESSQDTLDHRKVYINKIYIIGNEKTLPSIITRELSFKEKDSIEMHQLIGYQTEDRNKIYNTNLFITVEIQVLELEPDLVEVLINVTERWYLYPGVMFKLSDRNFSDWWVNRDHDLEQSKLWISI